MADAYINGKLEESVELKRKIPTERGSQGLSNVNELWNVSKRKRSRCRVPSVEARAFTLTPATYDKDVEAVQGVTGDINQAQMDSLPVIKQRTNFLPEGHIDKFLTGNPDPILKVNTRRMKSTYSEARVQHDTNISRFRDVKTDVNKTAGKLPVNGGPLYNRLLSALIDENLDLDLQTNKKTDPTRMQKWDTEFLGPVPDENLLLKELNLIGIYPEILPALVEKEDDTDHGNEEPQDVSRYPKLASEPPLLTRGRPRIKQVNSSKNEVNKESIPNNGTKRKRGRKPRDLLRGKGQKEPTIEIHEAKSKKVIQSKPNVNTQEANSASTHEQLIPEEDSIKGLDIINFNDPPEDISSMLDLDNLDEYLPQDGDDISCLDIPMDDISSLNFSFP